MKPESTNAQLNQQLHERNLLVFLAILEGKTTAQAADEFRISASRASQIFSKMATRILAMWNQRPEPKRTYPGNWRVTQTARGIKRTPKAGSLHDIRKCKDFWMAEAEQYFNWVNKRTPHKEAT
jgi:hypothetical protein